MSNLIIIFLFPLFFFLRLFVMHILPLTPLVAEPVLFSGLINKPLLISSWWGIGIGLINLLLIIIISRKLISNKIWYIPALLYAISPWTIYLEVGGSLYIPVLTCLLLMFISFKKVLNNKINFIILVTASSAAVYTSILMWFSLPLLIFSLFKLGCFNERKIKTYLLLVTLICLPLLFAAVGNVASIKNVLSNQVSIFSEVGLINSVNVFRGETAKTKYAILGKLVENRYFYLSQHFLFNFLKHFSPVTYFTPEFKMFSFSFNPPIMMGFLVPFFFGLKYLFDSILRNRWMLVTMVALLLPSILSKNSPDLNRLVLTAPVIFLLICNGFIELLNRKSLFYKLLLAVVFILVDIQVFVFISDIYLREHIRLHQILK